MVLKLRQFVFNSCEEAKCILFFLLFSSFSPKNPESQQYRLVRLSFYT